jgi:hypothetical protein
MRNSRTIPDFFFVLLRTLNNSASMLKAALAASEGNFILTSENLKDKFYAHGQF